LISFKSLLQVIVRHLWFGENIKEAIDRYVYISY